MCALQIILTVDPTLGRADYSSFSDQALMEMLLDGFDENTKQTYQDSDGAYLDVCEWSRMKCDADLRVTEIFVFSDCASGSLDLRYVPPKVKVLEIQPTQGKSKLTGSVDLTGLPGGMEFLCLISSRLTGEIDLTRLPEHIFRIDLTDNQLTGEIDLTQLPGGVKQLSLDMNRLTGEIDLTHLPARMYHLNLQNNRFTGEVDLTHLPEKMSYLYLNRNEFCGSLVIKCLPPGIRCINAQSNKFGDVALVDSEVHADINLRGSGVTSIVDENGEKLDRKRLLE